MAARLFVFWFDTAEISNFRSVFECSLFSKSSSTTDFGLDIRGTSIQLLLCGFTTMKHMCTNLLLKIGTDRRF